MQGEQQQQQLSSCRSLSLSRTSRFGLLRRPPSRLPAAVAVLAVTASASVRTTMPARSKTLNRPGLSLSQVAGPLTHIGKLFECTSVASQYTLQNFVHQSILSMWDGTCSFTKSQSRSSSTFIVSDCTVQYSTVQYSILAILWVIIKEP
jgi:hypothetical protein